MPVRTKREKRLLLSVAACLALAAVLPVQGSEEVSAPPPAAEEIVVRLTLEQALTMAEKDSPFLEERRALIRSGEASERLADSARMPDLDVSARVSRLSDVPEYAVNQPDGSRQVIFPNIPNRYGAAVDLRVPLYTGGRTRWGRTAAQWSSAAAAGDLAVAEDDLRLWVTDAFFRVLLAEEQSRVYAAGIEAFESHLADVENRIRFGLAAKNNLLAVQVERDKALLDRLEAERDRAVAAARLANLLGLPPQAVIEVEHRPLVGDDGAAVLAELIDEALAARPERAALQARVGAARAAAERERAEYKPLISAGAGYDYSRPNMLFLPPVDEFNDTWDVSVNLTYRFWDGGKRRARIERAESEAEAATRRLESLDLTIREQVTATWRELEAARAALPVAGAGLVSAEENRKVARDRYREGLLASSELLDAEVALLQAGLSRTVAEVQVQLGQARLARVLGR
jgi:outer membrane protein TolC